MTSLWGLIFISVIIIEVIGFILIKNKKKKIYRVPAKKSLDEVMKTYSADSWGMSHSKRKLVQKSGKDFLKELKISTNNWDISHSDSKESQNSVKGCVNIQSTWESPQPAIKENLKWDKAFLMELEWKLYEDVCMEYLRIKNCDAKVTTIGADGGMDMKVTDKNENVIAIAQCKAWNKPVGVSLIRELYGVMASERVKHGIFLTTSVYSNDAKAFAKGKALMLIDGEEFVSAINGLGAEERGRIDKLIHQTDHRIPTCVSCNTKLIKRLTKTGPNTGREFWGCVNYPKCKVTMHVRKAQ